MCLASFDPGQTGAIAFLTLAGALIAVHDMPTELVGGVGKARVGAVDRVSAAGIAALLRTYKPCSAIVERVGAMPKQGVSSTFVFGKGAGAIDGVLAALEIVPRMPTPAQWKRGMELDADKHLSVSEAVRLFPAHADRFRLVKHNGRAEAALLGLWHVRELAKAKERAAAKETGFTRKVSGKHLVKIWEHPKARQA